MPESYPIELYRGDSWSRDVVFWNDPEKTDPTDLTGVVATAQVRDAIDGGLVVDLVCTVEGNTVHVLLPFDAWGTEQGSSSGVWDLQMYNATAGTVWTPLAGPVRITGDVTPAPA